MFHLIISPDNTDKISLFILDNHWNYIIYNNIITKCHEDVYRKTSRSFLQVKCISPFQLRTPYGEYHYSF